MAIIMSINLPTKLINTIIIVCNTEHLNSL